MKTDWNASNLGKLIVALRAESTLSQVELASRVGISPVWLCCIERGRRNPTLGTLSQIAKALGKTLKIEIA